ncbi:MAG: class I SAM-dependent methyltransferase [Proteobacteria bacterium]|nr:class I SAM-dependent methyltransferase [Pseudomonadota bacterium]
MIEQAAKGTHDRVKEIVERINIKDGFKVLDAPCGSGVMAAYLNNKGFSVSAIDIIPPDRDTLDKKIDILQHDLNKPLPFEDETFDLCISVEGIEHLVRPTDFFNEYVRVLKRGGHMILTTPNTEALHSRFRYFNLGFPKYFEPKNEIERDAGHIHPIDRIFIERIRRKSGVKIEKITSNKLHGKKFPWPLLKNILTRRLPEMYRNEHLLYGDILVYHFIKE